MNPIDFRYGQQFPCLVRLQALACLEASDITILLESLRASNRIHAARTDVCIRGTGAPVCLILAEGWGCRYRTLSNGRRQIIDLLLPGDLLAHGGRHGNLQPASIFSITQIRLFEVPASNPSAKRLGEALAISLACEQAYLHNHVVRLGRQTAYERMLHLLLELRERLDMAGLVHDDSFALPLTQEQLADTLGLTSVHINRTLQVLRHERLIRLGKGMVTLSQLARIAEIAEYRPVWLPDPLRGQG